MQIQDELRDFLESLHRNEVKYLIIGGYTIAYNSRPGYSDDIKIWFEPSVENADKLIESLKEFGFDTMDLNIPDLTAKGDIIQLGYPPKHVDICANIDGLDFNSAWKNKVPGIYHTIPVFFISINDLISNRKRFLKSIGLNDVRRQNTYTKIKD